MSSRLKIGRLAVKRRKISKHGMGFSTLISRDALHTRKAIAKERKKIEQVSFWLIMREVTLLLITACLLYISIR